MTGLLGIIIWKSKTAKGMSPQEERVETSENIPCWQDSAEEGKYLIV